MNKIERLAAKIVESGCPHREGPYGLYNYESYGRERPYTVRDFRDVRSPEYGREIFSSENRDEAAAIYERLTNEHPVYVVLDALLGMSGELAGESPIKVMTESGPALLSASGARTVFEDMIRSIISDGHS